MIHPLLLAAERYSNQRYLDHALAICRHVIRSAWTDSHNQLRFHRLYHRVNNRWHRINEPMLIGGMGITLSSLQAATRLRPDPEIEKFLDAMDRTYAYYQSPAGFFRAASGWGAEQDLIPSTAWQSHDLFHLAQRHDLPADFWNTVFTPDPTPAVVLGPAMFWFESGQHWQLRGYNSAHGMELVGRKDRVNFHLDIPAWIGSGKEPPPDYQLTTRPQFVRTNTHLVQTAGPKKMHLLSACPLTHVPLA